MNVHLKYVTGQSYSVDFSNFKAKVSLNEENRVDISFNDQEYDLRRGYAAFSLPISKAQQLAHAILAASAGDIEPIEFVVDDSVKAQHVAASLVIRK